MDLFDPIVDVLKDCSRHILRRLRQWIAPQLPDNSIKNPLKLLSAHYVEGCSSDHQMSTTPGVPETVTKSNPFFIGNATSKNSLIQDNVDGAENVIGGTMIAGLGLVVTS
jgi:hypothetical protein